MTAGAGPCDMDDDSPIARLRRRADLAAAGEPLPYIAGDRNSVGGIDAPLAQSSGRELSQELLEGLFPRSVSGLNGFIEDR
jgi:hypothetical protein